MTGSHANSSHTAAHRQHGKGKEAGQQLVPAKQNATDQQNLGAQSALESALANKKPADAR
jgi:hypothetical protein